MNSIMLLQQKYELRNAIQLYGQPLLRYCHNILCDYFEAQDAVQMTFIKAYSKEAALKTKHPIGVAICIAYTHQFARRRNYYYFCRILKSRHLLFKG